ncbi:MAG: hypothetical protein OHK0012_24580 [Synechococcales cyanobacterium]
MHYSFEILGVLPILQFFHYQTQVIPARHFLGAEYLGSSHCTLDAFLGSLESSVQKRGWDLDAVTNAVVEFWVHNQEGIGRWQRRLRDAGHQSLVVARVSHPQGLQQEFDYLLSR